MREEGVVALLLRVGVAFAFIYPAVSAYFTPLAWIGFFPGFVLDIAPDETLLLHLFGITEIVLALWILVGRRIFVPSVLAALYLFAIVIFNLASLDILFRDIPIMFMAVALAVLHYNNHGAQGSTRGPLPTSQGSTGGA